MVRNIPDLLAVRQGLWHAHSSSAQPCSSSGSFGPWGCDCISPLSFTLAPSSREDPPSHKTLLSASSWLYASCSQLLGKETWWHLVCAGWRCSVPSIWEEHHWAIPVISLGALSWMLWRSGDAVGTRFLELFCVASPPLTYSAFFYFWPFDSLPLWCLCNFLLIFLISSSFTLAGYLVLDVNWSL